MSHPTVQLEIPQELMERALQIARLSNRPLETVLVESLEILFGTSADTPLEALEGYSDEKLWAIVLRQVAWPQEVRLRELIAYGKTQPLTDAEERELQHLVREVDRYTLLRSKALLLLKQKGHVVEQYLKLSA